jgi:hypothetical protein
VNTFLRNIFTAEFTLNVKIGPYAAFSGVGIDMLALVDIFSIYVAGCATDAILYVVMCCPI